MKQRLVSEEMVNPMIACLVCGGVALVVAIVTAVSAWLTNWYNRYRCRKHNCQHNCHPKPDKPILTLKQGEFCVVENIRTGLKRTVVGINAPSTSTPVYLNKNEKLFQSEPMIARDRTVKDLRVVVKDTDHYLTQAELYQL